MPNASVPVHEGLSTLIIETAESAAHHHTHQVDITEEIATLRAYVGLTGFRFRREHLRNFITSIEMARKQLRAVGLVGSDVGFLSEALGSLGVRTRPDTDNESQAPPTDPAASTGIKSGPADEGSVPSG